MQPMIFKQSMRSMIMDSVGYLAGLAITMILVYVGMNMWLGEAGIYGVKTLYLVIGIAVILTVITVNMMIGDAKFSVEIYGDQIDIYEEGKHYCYPIKESGFSFRETHSDRTGSSYTLYLTDSEGKEHIFDLTPVGEHFAEIKEAIATIQDLPPVQLITQDE